MRKRNLQRGQRVYMINKSGVIMPVVIQDGYGGFYTVKSCKTNQKYQVQEGELFLTVTEAARTQNGK